MLLGLLGQGVELVEQLGSHRGGDQTLALDHGPDGLGDLTYEAAILLIGAPIEGGGEGRVGLLQPLAQVGGEILRQDAGLRVPDAAPPAEDHFEEVLRTLLDGRLVAVLGADVGELADRLAQRFDYLEDMLK